MKKGEISIETIVIIILALLALVIIAAAFTGGMSKILGEIGEKIGFIPQGDTDAAIAVCQGYCDTGAKNSFCEHKFTGDLASKKCKDYVTTCSKFNPADC